MAKIVSTKIGKPKSFEENKDAFMRRRFEKMVDDPFWHKSYKDCQKLRIEDEEEKFALDIIIYPGTSTSVRFLHKMGKVYVSFGDMVLHGNQQSCYDRFVELFTSMPFLTKEFRMRLKMLLKSKPYKNPYQDVEEYLQIHNPDWKS